MHQEFLGRRLTANHRIPNPRFSVQIRASQPNSEGGARWRATGLENQAEQYVSRVQLLHLPPRCQNRLGYRTGSFRRRRLMVWQRFAKSPRIACAGSSPVASAKVSVVRSSDSTGGCQRSSLTTGRIQGPVAQRNESATVRRSRSHVQIVPGPPIQGFLRSGRAGKARVSETRLRRFESYLRSQFEKLTRSTLES
jgi:hypothetical protein